MPANETTPRGESFDLMINLADHEQSDGKIRPIARE